jgi:hypothetical protein
LPQVEPCDENEEGAIMCQICTFSYKKEHFFHLPGCNHEFCRNCMGEHLASNIKDGKVVKIKCMDFECQEEFTEKDIHNFGSEEIVKKYTKFTTDIRVETDPNLKWCPRNNCGGFARRQRGRCCGWKDNAICNSCHNAMCFKCGAVAHPGASCNSVGNAELREYIKNSNVVKCPNCGFGTEKIDGCNHMTCAKCRYDWCWLCRGKYYDNHFEPWNMFGCPGSQYGSPNVCKNISKKVLMIILMPLVLYFGAAGIAMHALCYQLS